MSLWLSILEQASLGNSSDSQRLLSFELPHVLRWPQLNPATRQSHYSGPIPKIVRIFMSRLPESDRGMARSRADDFVDYITDLVLAKVRRTVSLVEFCHKNPEFSVEQIAEGFAGWDGLKLGKDEKAKWVMKHLRSMSAAGIQITSLAAESSLIECTNVDDLKGYDELALVNGWRPDLSWKDFKAQEEIDASYLSASESDSEDEPGISEEAFDYGSLNAARVVLSLSQAATGEIQVDLNRIGGRLTAELLDLVETFHANKPLDGYFPIAWHNVWWTIVSRYEAVPLELDTRDPFCDVDRTLADYIGDTYPAVLKPSRLNIFRRRTRFQDKCVGHAQSVLIAWNEMSS